MDELFADLGLTVVETKIYRMLLQEGASSAGTISKKTGVHRRNSYDALERLIHKGLVGYIKENNRKKYSITNPEVIADQLQRKTDTFKAQLPQLLAQFHAQTEDKETVFFRGTAGLRLVFVDQLNVGKEILVLATSSKVSHILKYFFPRYQLVRKQKRIKTRMLFDERYRKDPKALGFIQKLPLAEVRFVRDVNRSPLSQYIYGNTVALVVWSDDPVAIVMRQREIAEGFRDSFEQLWNM